MPVFNAFLLYSYSSCNAVTQTPTPKTWGKLCILFEVKYQPLQGAVLHFTVQTKVYLDEMCLWTQCRPFSMFI